MVTKNSYLNIAYFLSRTKLDGSFYDKVVIVENMWMVLKNCLLY